MKAQTPNAGQAGATDIGPFELLEARRAIEAEACAMAAKRITNEELDQLDGLVAEMQAENTRDVDRSEDADKRFHMLIAASTQNAAVELLWEARERSPQTKLMGEKAHAAGVIPRIDEHAAIVSALRARSPEDARDAMRRHLTRVLNSLLAATEVQELEEAKARIAAARDRYT